jgi:hypothetical protein
MATATLQPYATKPRVFILASSSSADSLCRYLLYANQFSTEGIVACTSTHQRTAPPLESLHATVDAYASVADNLNAHAHAEHPYPRAAELKGLIKTGAAGYGMSAIGDDIPISAGAQLLYDRILAPSLQPLWVLCWGGTNTLAQALLEIDSAFSPEDSQRLLSRLRVYAISDQDDTGAWIRNSFPDVFYIASVHGWGQYGLAAWTGISGEQHYGFDQGGPDHSTLAAKWIKDNIQIGSLGSIYSAPKSDMILESATPTFFHLLQNGLSAPDTPSFGSWGGRYARTDISTTGLNSNHHSDAVDRVVGSDGRTYTSNQATIWRWRNAFQNDFAARMHWSTTSNFREANHHPVVSINKDAGLHPLRLEAEAGESITLDASASYDPDQNDTLTFKWWQYKEPSATQWHVDAEVPTLVVTPLDEASRKVQVALPPPELCAVDYVSKEPVVKGQLLHLILEVTDSGNGGAWPLTTYRRVLIQAMNNDLRGGKAAVASVPDVVLAGSPADGLQKMSVSGTR